MSSGINLDKAREALKRTSVEHGKVTVVGTLNRVKNFETVIRAVKRIDGSRRVNLNVLGDGPMRSELEALAAGDARIRFHGRLPKDGVYSHLASSQVFVMPSIRTPGAGEGVPTALLEAMALSNDCLVSTQSLPAPVVDDGTAYTPFHPTDDRALTELIVASLDDWQGSRFRARRAERSVRHLDWPIVAQRVRDVYSKAIGRE
jgi:glycosyltransferase involved in cell wall biosynthesis